MQFVIRKSNDNTSVPNGSDRKLPPAEAATTKVIAHRSTSARPLLSQLFGAVGYHNNKRHHHHHHNHNNDRKGSRSDIADATPTTTTEQPSHSNGITLTARAQQEQRRHRAAGGVRVGSHQEQLRKNRRAIDHYLRRLGALMGKKDISLNLETGVCYFPYRRFIVVVEVPEDEGCDGSGGTGGGPVLFLYTMVCRLKENRGENAGAVLRLCMQLNYMQTGTRGATLGLDGEEVNLCYSTGLHRGFSFADLRRAVESFLVTASEANEQLEAAKRAPSPPHVADGQPAIP